MTAADSRSIRAASSIRPPASGGASSCRTTAASAAWSPWSRSPGKTTSRLIGLPGNLRKAPNTWIKPDYRPRLRVPSRCSSATTTSTSGKLNPLWQWNHVPDDAQVVAHGEARRAAPAFACRPPTSGWPAIRLTQRPIGPESIGHRRTRRRGHAGRRHRGPGAVESTLCLDRPGENDDGHPAADVRPDRIAMRLPRRRTTPATSGSASPATSTPRQAIFSWSTDGKSFAPVGRPFTMVFQLKTFQGVRFALFNYNTSGQPGGHADFDNFTVDEPRAWHRTRRFRWARPSRSPVGADGSFDTRDAQATSLVKHCRNIARRYDRQCSIPCHRPWPWPRRPSSYGWTIRFRLGGRRDV